jgi:predicted component of type VI protein secretion system
MLPLVIKVEQVDGNVRRYAFAESPVSVGRSPFADLQLSEPFVSRWEGTIRFDDREISYFSLRATNSTYLDGRSIESHEEDIPLGIESVLTLGELKLRFTREPVADSDLRRKGKRRPTRDDPPAAHKTVYLDCADAWLPAKSQDQPPPDKLARKLPPPPPDKLARKLPPIAAGAADAPARRSYREARAAWLREIHTQLARLPERERGAFLRSLQREEPTLFSDPELQAASARAGLAPAQEIPELQAWLREIARDLLPANVQFDSRLALSRVLLIVEALVQALAEVHEAQESVRQRWLGQSPRRSVLQSDKAKLVLAYLLNPQADWNERREELEQTIRDVVTHELALFKAMLEGARSLIDALSPETIAAAESSEADESGSDGFWTRWRKRRAQALEPRLWRRLLASYAELRDGDRFERVFLGRSFARSYLAAMGHRDKRAAPS